VPPITARCRISQNLRLLRRIFHGRSGSICPVQESLRALARRYGINQKTVAKWKNWSYPALMDGLWLSLTVSQVGALATRTTRQAPGDVAGQLNADGCDGRFDVASGSDRRIRVGG